jgi:hypothetical protein
MLFDRHDSIHDIAHKLSTEFAHVTNIGEIDLTKGDFRILCASVRDTWDKHTIAPEVVAAVLVFCARYAEYREDERIRFWDKFSQDVLKRDLTQQIGNDWRDKFKVARDKLREKYGFNFPTRRMHTQHVISGIYNHAILPAYIADDFVEWFLKQYPTIDAWFRLRSYHADELAENQLAQIEVKQPHIRLKLFLSEEITRLTAARLVRNLATAAWWYVQGELEGDDIAAILSPIELSLWHRVAPQLDRLHLTPSPATSRETHTSIQWAWFFDQNDILELHVKNVQVNTHTKPDRLVWVPANTDVREGETVTSYGTKFCEVNAWNVGEGYIIDNATLIDIREVGWVVPVDTDDRALAKPIKTIELPVAQDKDDKKVVLFRAQPNISLAILSDWDRLTSGDYAISHGDDFTIRAVDEGEVTRNYGLPVPEALREQGHTGAAHYTLRLPVEINGVRINPQRNRVSPVISGEHLIEGLLPGALPIYTYGGLWLSFTEPQGVPLGKLSLELVVNGKVTIHRLVALDAAGHIERVEDHGQTLLKLDLIPYIDHLPALVQATVFNGLSPMHAGARTVGLLSEGISVEPDSTNEYYSLSKRPSVCLTGVTREQIELASVATADEVDKHDVIVTWDDPRQDAALRLKFGALQLPLTFDVKWFHGWIAPLKDGNWLSEDRLDEAHLHVRGKSKSWFYIEVEGGSQSSNYILNSLGAMDVEVRFDRLKDLLMGYEGAEGRVYLVFDRQREDKIELCTFVRPGYQPAQTQPPIPTAPIISVSSPSETTPNRQVATPRSTKTVEPEVDWGKRALSALKQYPNYRHRTDQYTDAHLLALVAPSAIKGLSFNAVPGLLSPLMSLSLNLISVQRRLFPPDAEWLWVGGEKYEIHTDLGGKYIFIPRPTTQGESEARVGVEEREGQVYLRPTNNLLRQCEVCKHPYWQDDRGAKIKHAHNGPVPKAIHLSHNPINGSIRPFGGHLTSVRDYVFDFTPFVNRDILLLPRNATTPTASRRPHDLSSQDERPWLSWKGYEGAVAEWVSLTTVETNTSIDQLCQMEPRLQRLMKLWPQSPNPALVWASQWITYELRARQHKGSNHPPLIPNLMVLAVIARAYARGSKEVLRNEDEKQLVETGLRLAYSQFRPLLTWAVVWSELNFAYWENKIR